MTAPAPIVRVWKRHSGDGWYRTVTSTGRQESFPDSAAADRAAARHGLAVRWDQPHDSDLFRFWDLAPLAAATHVGYAGELADICARLDDATDLVAGLHGRPDERDVDRAEQMVRRAATDLERVVKAIRGEAVA